MQYIVVQRYKRDDARGKFNLPYGTIIEEHGGILYYDGRAICNDHSAVMREYFRRNDDGCGMLRGKIIERILKKLRILPGETKEEWNERWNIVWEDALCQRYKQLGQQNHWLWNIGFYNAPIMDLEYIAALVGAGKG